MTISPTLEELETGLISKRWSEKQRENIAEALAYHRPVGLKTPAILNRRYISMVLLHGLREQPHEMAELSFTPIWNRAMIGCHIRSSKIRLLVIQFDHGQYEFDDNEERPSDRTMEGSGVDPNEVDKSALALIKLINQKPIQAPVVLACRHIEKVYGKQLQPA